MLSLKATIQAVITPAVEEAFVCWLHKHSDASDELYVARLVKQLQNMSSSRELELEFCAFVAERAGFADIMVDDHFMSAYTWDFVEWR